MHHVTIKYCKGITPYVDHNKYSNNNEVGPLKVLLSTTNKTLPDCPTLVLILALDLDLTWPLS